MTSLTEARAILRREGWLARQPKGFQDALLAGGMLQCYPAGHVVYRFGDPAGGIFGLVSGAMCATIGPPKLAPRLLYVGAPGSWMGEGGFLTREPRRIGVSVPVETWIMHVPLGHLDRMPEGEADTFRRVTQILMGNLDILARAYCEQQVPDERFRIASALLRLPVRDGEPVPISQTDLATMSNVSRKTVNVALREFAGAGWIGKGYRTLTILDRSALSAFAGGVEG